MMLLLLKCKFVPYKRVTSLSLFNIDALRNLEVSCFVLTSLQMSLDSEAGIGRSCCAPYGRAGKYLVTMIFEAAH